MKSSTDIVKVGAAVVRDGRLLLVRKRGLSVLILPGGKPDAGEEDEAALVREIDEELGCGVASGSFQPLGSFTDRSADGGGRTVTVRLYAVELEGEPTAQAEIESIDWLDRAALAEAPLAPSLANLIVPALVEGGVV